MLFTVFLDEAAGLFHINSSLTLDLFFLYPTHIFFFWMAASPDDVVGSGETPISTFPLLRLW